MLAAQGHAWPEPEQPKKRQMIMCPRCRKDKQFCKFPADQPWSPIQKCLRCEQMRYECGKPERKARAPRTPRLPARCIPPSPNEQELLVNRARNGNAQMEYDVTALARTLQTDAVIVPQLPNTNAHRPRPLPAALGLGQYIDSPDTDRSSTQHSEDIAGPSRKDLENQARRLLVSLGDHLALRALLSSDLRDCDLVEGWLGKPNPTAREALEAALASLETSFRTALEAATSFATRNLGGCKVELLAQLMLYESRFAEGSNMDHTRSVPKNAALRQMFAAQQRRKGSCSEADNLCGFGFNVDPSSLTELSATTSESDLLHRYAVASAGITRVLAGLVFDNSVHRQLLLGSDTANGPILTYPAGHIAIPTAPSAIHFQLRRCRSTPSLWEIDCLRRTPVHVAAYCGRLESLIHVFREDPATARGTLPTDLHMLPDLYGLTPLMITACRNDVRGFNILSQFGADLNERDGEGRTLLALAARNGSEGIVEAILGSRIVPFSDKSELCEAIIGGHKLIAQSLLAHLRLNSSSSDFISEVDEALTIAKERSLNDIAEMLSEAITNAQTTSVAAVASVDILDYSQYIDFADMVDDTSMDSAWTMQFCQQ